jgi:hypothetical protein
VSKPYILNTRPPYAAAWSKSSLGSLAAALLGAWRKRQKDFSVGDVTRDGRVVVESQRVSQLLDEMDEVMRAEPKSQPREVAEGIARRIGEDGGAEAEAFPEEEEGRKL